MTERFATNLQASLILAAYLILLLIVPHQVLRPLSVGVLAFAVLVVVGLRAYLRRLEQVARLLDSNRTSPPAPLLVALLSEPERAVLRLDDKGTSAEIISAVRRRQSVLTSAAMCVAIPGICAFAFVVFFFLA